MGACRFWRFLGPNLELPITSACSPYLKVSMIGTEAKWRLSGVICGCSATIPSHGLSDPHSPLSSPRDGVNDRRQSFEHSPREGHLHSSVPESAPALRIFVMIGVRTILIPECRRSWCWDGEGNCVGKLSLQLSCANVGCAQYCFSRSFFLGSCGLLTPDPWPLTFVAARTTRRTLTETEVKKSLKKTPKKKDRASFLFRKLHNNGTKKQLVGS